MAAEERGGGQFRDVADFCAKLGGATPVRKILISNNGIAAVKAIRSIRRWAYDMFGNEREVCSRLGRFGWRSLQAGGSPGMWRRHRLETQRTLVTSGA